MHPPHNNNREIENQLLEIAKLSKNWITPPETGDNRWEFQPIFYNPNINFKKVSKGRKFIIPEDFGFKPDSYLLSPKLPIFVIKENLKLVKSASKRSMDHNMRKSGLV